MEETILCTTTVIAGTPICDSDNAKNYRTQFSAVYLGGSNEVVRTKVRCR